MAIDISSNVASYFANMGLALHELKQFKNAINNYDQAIKLKLNYAEAFFNRGNSLRDLKQLDSAIDSYNQAIFINPKFYTRGKLRKQVTAYDYYDR